MGEVAARKRGYLAGFFCSTPSSTPAPAGYRVLRFYGAAGIVPILPVRRKNLNGTLDTGR